MNEKFLKSGIGGLGRLRQRVGDAQGADVPIGDLFTQLVQWAASHPLMAAGLLLVFGFISLLEMAHIVQVFGKCVLVLIRELKHEVIGAGDVGREVKKELSSWEEHRR